MKRTIRYALALSCAVMSTATANLQTNNGIGSALAQEMVRHCLDMMSSDKSLSDAAYRVNDFSECMSDYMTGILIEKSQDLHREMSMSREVAFHNEKFTCQDLDRETSAPQYMTSWQRLETHGNQIMDHNYTVQVHLDRPAAKIHVIPNFATQEECDAMIAAGKDHLQAAAVADGTGGSTVNKVRKANQGHVFFHLDDEDQTIPNVFRRIYAYAHHATGLDLDVAGQETLNSIEYIGRGLNDTNPDHYKPHCDGHCNGREHMEGNRIATMIIYTRAPDVGGHTNFGRANVHIKPRAGDAIFFSYMDPETQLYDTGLTEHSACPVYEGTKNIVTHWMRLGVSLEKPFFDFNSLGKYDPIKRPDTEDQVLVESKHENTSITFDAFDASQSQVFQGSNGIEFSSLESQTRNTI